MFAFNWTTPDVLVDVEAIITLFADVESVLKYNSAMPFVTRLNLYDDVLPGARKPLSQIVWAPLVLDVYEAIFICDDWAFDVGWVVARLAELVETPLSTTRVIPLLPEYSWLDELGATGTWQTILDVLLFELKEVKLITGHGWPFININFF